jgi:hypothetical protein
MSARSMAHTQQMAQGSHSLLSPRTTEHSLLKNRFSLVKGIGSLSNNYLINSNTLVCLMKELMKGPWYASSTLDRWPCLRWVGAWLSHLMRKPRSRIGSGSWPLVLCLWKLWQWNTGIFLVISGFPWDLYSPTQHIQRWLVSPGHVTVTLWPFYQVPGWQ